MSLEDAIRAAVVDALRSDEARHALREVLAHHSPTGGVVNDDANRAYSVARVAELSGYTAATILDRIAAGDLRASKPGGCREWRILRQDYLAWLAGSDGGGEQESRDPDDVVRAVLRGG